MSRRLRPHIPGLAFHITARTQAKEALFAERLRGTIERHIIEGVSSSDSVLMAHTVMSNHFHIVLRQGTRPLGWVMQPIMRRIALLVQRAFDRKGHVFEGPFRAVACENADHLRRAIVYTHINPVRARMCSDACEYPWTSHARYLLDRNGGAIALEIVHALKLFADRPECSLHDLSSAYLRYAHWRLEKDRHIEAGTGYAAREPESAHGDRHFAQNFCSLPTLWRKPKADLRDKAIELLEKLAPGTSVETLRRRTLSRPGTAIRNQLIAGLLQAGYRGKQISDFLRISDSTVSAVATAMRYVG